jgi:hypothetical protein
MNTDRSQLSALAARIAATVTLFALLGVGAGCSTIVHPPGQPLSQPTVVYITDETIHSSVIVPTDDGRHVEYAFGDWTYAALNRHDPYHVVQALFFSPQGALGRRYLDLKPDATPMAPQLKGITVDKIVVERDQVRELVRTLDARFHTDRPQAENPDNHFIWVKVDDGYALWRNCNTLTKSNLRNMGCEVESRSVFAMYDVQRPSTLMYASEAPAVRRSTGPMIGAGKMR